MRYTFIYKLLVAAIIMTAVTACSNNSPKQTKNTRENLPATGTFGQPFNDSIFYSAESIIERLKTENEFDVTVAGTILNYCRGEGCWITLTAGQSELLVETKNKSFALPLNISDKKAIVHGVAHNTYNNDSIVQPQITATGIQIQ